ncbi:adenylyl-sulfate kinase [Microbacterium indicum]|uniref:adenylyl-sulfate kinase n=1 Tax=Microbacterium indicum TaxID=358100 RepID=UPI00041CCB54|nr:adenylyl-sulfate kinase [Microbacterium indicum]
MTERSLTLTSPQLRIVELALAGAWGSTAELAFDDPAIAVGDELVLFDEEGTDVASLRVDAVSVSGGGPAPVEQIGTGEAPDLPARVVVSGSVSARRALGHRDRADLRVGAGFARVPRAVLIEGGAPASLPDTDDPVIVVDRGDGRALAASVAAVEAAGRRAIVLPGAGDRTLAAARELVADEIEVVEAPADGSEGVVVLLTGLSGSGKSTISKLLVERLAAVDPRTTTLLDGDEVRQILSAGLGFTRDDRMLNIRRIGWVAALVAKHGGIAVCAPIAPYEAMREEMRERVEQVGRFVLVHVATPLPVCAERDRKGLYAKAMAGEIGEFTGVSDPYQIPAHADLTIDASVVEPADAVERILAVLRA